MKLVLKVLNILYCQAALLFVGEMLDKTLPKIN